MPTYAIGDVRGNFQALEQFLEQVKFDQTKDTLWFTGNLIGDRGDSLAVLQFVKDLGTRAITVLGEEELRLLAVAHGVQVPGDVTAFSHILDTPDCEALMKWLRYRPFLHHEHNCTLVHAGVPADWTLTNARTFAFEAETSLTTEVRAFLENMFGDEPPPPIWHKKHRGYKRVRFIVHAFTRMQSYDNDGNLYFSSNGFDDIETEGRIPWYLQAKREMANQNIILGHSVLPEGTAVRGIHGLCGSSEPEGSPKALQVAS